MSLVNGKYMKLTGSTSETVDLLASCTTMSYNLTLPSAQGASGQVMTNNGSGALS